MGVLFDYFAAASDADAATVIDRMGGPGAQALPTSQTSSEGRGWFRRRHATPPAPADHGVDVFDTIQDTGIDPVVQLGTLEELLTGRPYDDVVADPRSGQALASRNGGELMVCAVTQPLTEALANTPWARLREIAAAWSQTEEFWGEADPEDLEGVLTDLAGLAQRAQASGQNLYCWTSV